MPALSQSDLIFSTQSLNFSSTLHSLKRSALSITNRLNSITSDSKFAIAVADAYKLPLVANERCGSWYIPPEKKAGSVYFKSTDGHMNEWSFNLRRLNLQLLDLVGGKAGGCVIVDSTRRGKSMPDALSKTVPIWCCVMNRAIFAETGPHKLYTPPTAVSASEHAQIENRLEGFVRDFLNICKPSLPDLRQKLQKPLRPIWVTQASTLPDSPPDFTDFHPIVLCTASRRVHGGEVSEGGYVQGAADDHEAWACGLTPKLFWANHEKLMSTNEEDLPAVIGKLAEEEKGPDAVPVLIKPTTNLYISSSENVDISPFNVIISCTPEPLTTRHPDHLKEKKYLHFPLQTGKLGSRDLRAQLYRLPKFLESLPEGDLKFLVCDPTGKDLAVGVALSILCQYTDEDGKISTTPVARKIDKTYIKQRLTWITTTSPVLNPSRETLKSVNSYLMPDASSASKFANVGHSKSKLTLVDADGAVIEPPSTEISEPVSKASEPSSPPPKDDNITAIFKNLHTPGTWNFTRTLRSALPTHPSGTVTGTATFTPFALDGQAQLYSEEGEFVTDNGLRFTARRKYVYHLNAPGSATEDADGADDDEQQRSQEKEGKYISILFFYEDAANAADSGKTFVEMGEVSQSSEGVWEARNREQHLCGQDWYAASWKFGAGMIDGHKEDGDMWWVVRYDVKGPQKDYVSETRYTRPS